MSRRTGLPRITRHAAIDSSKLQVARQFRQTPTAAEALAWKLLRNRRLFGLKFRRQQIIAGFIVDFFCASARLAVELDGGVHQDAARREYDEERTRVLACHGVRVLRIANQHVHEQALRDLLAPYAVADSPA